MDPAVGDGAFLLTAANWIDRQVALLCPRMSEAERRRSIIADCLHGVDISLDAVEACRSNLAEWAGLADESDDLKLGENISHGNSLLNADGNGRFDVVLGNPPYGNILSNEEREYIQRKYPVNVGGGRKGTWNSATHFIVRASMFLRPHGLLGFLVPNSILRVGQFQKTRDFLLKELALLKIIDEASPFDDVTLEMVTLICMQSEVATNHCIEVESRRPGFNHKNTVPYKMLASSRIFPIYHDAIFAEILSKGTKGILKAKRGKDIPRSHTRKEQSRKFNIPYITSGRSVRRYGIEQRYLSYADDWYKSDRGLMESSKNEILVATKNYRYPRCIIKPKGTLHGGGIVHIKVNSERPSLRTLGLILNSRLIQHICSRYLTNYSQLTTCLNTGIMEDLPLVIPKNETIFEVMYSILERLHQDRSQCCDNEIAFFEEIGDALVYELYFGDGLLSEHLSASLGPEMAKQTLSKVMNKIGTSVQSLIHDIFSLPQVVEIEARLDTGY